jgi:hypothetical protein
LNRSFFIAWGIVFSPFIAINFFVCPGGILFAL